MSLLAVAANVRRAMRSARPGRVSRPDQMQLVLPDLRAIDPAFALELADGQLALSTGPLAIGRPNAFDQPIADDAARRELYGFSWLRHLHGARTHASEDLARRQILAWAASMSRRLPIAHEPAVAARRTLSLLAHIDVALAGANAQDFDLIMDVMADEVATLADAALRMPLAMPRLMALTALAAYQICSGSADGARQSIERRLASELDRQILPDGGHISRSPAALIELALDLIPLQRAYMAAQLTPPRALSDALLRMSGMIRLLSHGDQQLARFNGMGVTELTDLGMLEKTLPRSAKTTADTEHATASGYIRVSNGNALLLFDAGPGPDTLAGDAPFAGALSFEFSADKSQLIVNAGSDHGAFKSPRLEARSTAQHSALCLANTSSAPPTGARGGSTKAALVALPGDTTATTIRASTDGYRQRFGYVHHRTVSLLRDGWLLEGFDRLDPVAESTIETPFDVRFHIHPSVYLEADATRRTLRLTAADGSRWAMTVTGAEAFIEPSTFHATGNGPKSTVQVVLRGKAKGETEVHWRLERMSPAAVS